MNDKPSTHYAVEVCDDHDGGSVWINDEDYFPEESDADEYAAKVSKLRDNKLARVTQNVVTPMREYRDGQALPEAAKSESLVGARSALHHAIDSLLARYLVEKRSAMPSQVRVLDLLEWMLGRESPCPCSWVPNAERKPGCPLCGGPDPIAALETANHFGVTARDGRVLILALGNSFGQTRRTFSPDEVLQLASWLIVGAEMAGHENAVAVVGKTVLEIHNV